MKKEMNDKASKVLEKVKKLLALADQSKNNSEEEAKAAALKAQKLMAEYNLTLTDAEEDEKLEITDARYNCGGDNQWKFSLASVIARNFRCEVFWLNKKIACFYGYKTDAEIAKEVFGTLFKICKKRMTQVADAEYYRTGSSRGVRYAFTQGFVAGVKSALDAQCTALMIVVPKEVSDQYNEEIVKTSKTFGIKYQGTTNNGRFQKKFYEQGQQEGREAMNKRSIEGGN
jgi:hypothetical protein